MNSVWLLIIAVAAFLFLVGIVTASLRRRRPLEDATTRYIRALNHLLRGDEASAQEELIQAVRQNTDNIDAYLKLAEIFRLRGDAARAVRIERELLVRSGLTREERMEIEASLGRSYEAQRDWARAAETLRRLTDSDPRNAEYHRSLIRVLESGGEWEGALDARRRSLKVSGESGRRELALVMGWLARRRFAEGKEKEGRSLLKEAFSHDPDCPSALLLRGERAEKAGRLEEAIHSWSQLARKRSQWGELAFRRLEQAHYELGSFEKMVAFFQELLREDAMNVAPRLHLAEILHRKGESDDAIRLLQEGLEIERRSEEARRLRGLLISIHRELGNYAQALAEVERAGWLRQARDNAFRCRACDVEIKEFDWRCPSCGGWGTIRGIGIRVGHDSVGLPFTARA